MKLAITIIFALIGSGVGSFLNVVALRSHGGQQFFRGRSACQHCKKHLKPLDLVPILSWAWLRGKCRYCGKPISRQYPLVELSTAVLFALAYLTHPVHSTGDAAQLLLWFYIIASFIVLTIYDVRWYLLPDKVLLPVVVPAFALIVIETAASGSATLPVHTLMAAAVFGGLFYFLALVSKGRWMGGGDIKLAAIIGLLLGLQKTTLAMVLAFDVAAIVSVILILVGRKKRTDLIPFGPFLMGATLIAYFCGSAIIDWFVQIN